ncbi:putative peptidoglycan biosynthesis protein MurJ [Streptococcus mitis]|jgi:flippase wzx|uniref:Putative peptidoglycan biosynthesis protein MurJ n=1 Tax=Streptococcus mitis TaxID=28037 RepID=A0A428EF97_STRMT|nr:lipid II flippase MurJ [Streptococcus mitis]RSI81280.1 putative peptidoglycan biosynthesis protein MurJ [Streptococcus mitis]RSI82967.1 putative peptidoglycan biosynthesis protein MurJ [Streptococcus mitis]RSJ08786.1 putative peptidoglycan biosynthesis protein MurJ [Streptococcus mitis]
MNTATKSNQNKKTAVQLTLMIILTCLSQIVALYKSRFTAVSFGATDYMDAYNFSLEIATFIFSFVTGGVTTVIIPAYVKKISSKAVNTFITLTYGCILLLSVGLIIFRIPLLSSLTARGTDFIAIASDFLIISFVIQGILSLLAVTTAYYQSEDRYNIPKIIVLIVNMIVLTVLLLGVIDNIYLYFSLLIAGSVLNLILDFIVAIKIGFRYKFCFDFKNPEFKNMMIVFWPIVLSSGVYKLHTMVDTTIATNLAVGQATILTYASQVITMVNTVIVGNLTVYVYPKIIANLKTKNISKYFWDYCILFHAVLAIIIAGFVNVGFEGLSLLFFGGKFTLENVNVLYMCACVYISGQQFNVIRDLIYRYFYANSNTKETFKNSVIVSIIKIILSLLLVSLFGVYGIVLGTVLSNMISLALIYIRFKKNFGIDVKISYIFIEITKNILAMIGSVIVIHWLKIFLAIDNNILSIIVYGIGTIIVYLVLILLLQTKIRHIKL